MNGLAQYFTARSIQQIALVPKLATRQHQHPMSLDLISNECCALYGNIFCMTKGVAQKSREENLGPQTSPFSRKYQTTLNVKCLYLKKKKKETNRTRSPWIKITTHSAAPAITTLLS